MARGTGKSIASRHGSASSAVEILKELEQAEAWTKMEEWPDGEQMEKGI